MRQDFVPESPPIRLDPISGWLIGFTNESSEAMGLRARRMTQLPLARSASTQEISNGALFLAAPTSSDITGHVLPIDGGLRKGLLT